MKTFGYENAGRKTSVVSSAGKTSLDYDYESRLTSISGGGITSETYTYNGLDTRVSKTVSSVTTTYARDGAYVTDPVLRDSGASYTPGISERRGSTTTFQHSGIKNIDAQTGTAQTVAATRQYDAFGNVTSSTGTWSGPFGNAGGFGYQEDATGLKLLGHRYYDSSIGRFLTRDKAKDGRNWYVYADNSPISFCDPNGMVKISVYYYTVVNALGQTFVHMLILVTDNIKGSPTYGQSWTYSGGPEHHTTSNGLEAGTTHDYGNLVGYGRPWKGRGRTGGQDDRNWDGGMVIVDDQSSTSGWREIFDRIVNRIVNSEYDYRIFPDYNPGSGNSNSFIFELLLETGLLDELYQAAGKRPKSLPSIFAPGWGIEL